jgi:hypothetical protein
MNNWTSIRKNSVTGKTTELTGDRKILGNRIQLKPEELQKAKMHFSVDNVFNNQNPIEYLWITVFDIASSGSKIEKKLSQILDKQVTIDSNVDVEDFPDGMKIIVDDKQYNKEYILGIKKLESKIVINPNKEHIIVTSQT